MGTNIAGIFVALVFNKNNALRGGVPDAFQQIFVSRINNFQRNASAISAAASLNEANACMRGSPLSCGTCKNH